MPSICPTCQQKIRKLNKHVMDKQKVTMLEIMVKLRRAGVDWVMAKAGERIQVNGQPYAAPYRAQAHISRLVWFGLAEHDPQRRSGLYRATFDGRDFLLGKHMVPEWILCKDGMVFERSTALVNVYQVKSVVLDKSYWDSYWSHGQR